MRHLSRSCLPLLVVLLWAMLCALAYAEPDAVATDDAAAEQPVDAAQYFAAKAAAGGVIEGELAELCRKLAQEDLLDVQLELERYSIDSMIPVPGAARGEFLYFYPQHINQLVFDPSGNNLIYIEPGFYANPVTAASADERNAIEVPFGWSDIAPGNFTYLPRYDDKGRVIDYILMVYGPRCEEGLDMDGDGTGDGVIAWVSSQRYPLDAVLELLDHGRKVTLHLNTGQTGMWRAD